MVDTSSQDARRFVPLSAPQFNILLALADEDRHGYGIILEIADRTAGALRLGTGTLYTALAGLAETGLVAGSNRPRPGGPGHDERRRYYRLTPLGRAVLQLEVERLDGLVRQARRKGLKPAPARGK
jgi:DNA-binding PadR family transcriptional regulator